MRFLMEVVFTIIIVFIMTGCGPNRVLVKDCDDIDGGIKDCELIRAL